MKIIGIKLTMISCLMIQCAGHGCIHTCDVPHGYFAAAEYQAQAIGIGRPGERSDAGLLQGFIKTLVLVLLQ